MAAVALPLTVALEPVRLDAPRALARHRQGGRSDLGGDRSGPQQQHRRQCQPTAHGVYDNRENQAEAKRVADHLEKSLHLNHSIGVVAFSETQLECIYNQLSEAAKIKLEERIENNSLFFKALENVQGEECDQLIISVGYGRDPEGEFHMRFGPLNSKNGARRLNVLLTRARKKMIIFSSIRSGDFKLSSNEAVELFRQFFQQIENQKSTQQAGFTGKVKAEIKGKEVILRDLYASIQNADELVTFLRVLESRGWKIQLV